MVYNHMNREIYIVGGGPSLKGFDFSRLQNKPCIAVNKSIFDVPNAKYFITMDYTFKMKIAKRLEEFNNTPSTKVFVVNYASGSVKDIDGQIRDVRFKILYDLQGFDVIIKSRRVRGVGDNFKTFCNGDNSGYCALQFAILMGYTTIHLLGIDLIVDNANDTHYHGGYGYNTDKVKRNLMKFLPHFEYGVSKAVRSGINIISYNPMSPLSQITDTRSLSRI